jgi:proton-translocating NADH-quinone oxidoreductase chain M
MKIINILLILGIFGILIKKKNLVSVSLIYTYIIFLIATSILIIYLPIMNFITEKNVKGELIIKYILGFINGIDGLSIIMIILSSILFIVCVLSGEKIIYRKKLYLLLLLFSEILLINLFIVSDLFYFYILFESVLIPMFIIIGIWGSRSEKISAAYQFYIYTLIGSLFMLITIISIFLLIGTTNVWEVKGYQFNYDIERIFWVTFFLAFSIKIPMYPFHLWLPKAHVEAPTAGSVLLAGILLKLGGYGLIRFNLFLFPMSTIYFRPLIILLAFLGVIYSSFSILRQIDLKRIVAYSSISHMNLAILGCFGGNIITLQGSILLMIAHGLVSGGLFLCVGYLYDRYKSRNLLYYRYLKNIMPMFGVCFFLLVLSNIGFPPTLNFLSEFFIISGFFESQQSLIFLIGVSVFFAGISGFLTYTRVFFGNFVITKGYTNIYYFYDLTRREFCSIIPLIFLTFFFGVLPTNILNITNYCFSAWGI